jgi:hypothetical protein
MRLRGDIERILARLFSTTRREPVEKPARSAQTSSTKKIRPEDMRPFETVDALAAQSAAAQGDD